MQPQLSYAHSALPSSSSLHAPFTPLEPAPLSATHSRPHLEVYTGQDVTGRNTASSSRDEYAVRDMFTPSPSSSTFLDTPLPAYSPEMYALPPYSAASPSSSDASPSSIGPSRRQARRLSEPCVDMDGLVVRGPIVHPYARLNSKKLSAGKRRKMWNHALEKLVFTPHEISSMGAPHRRTIYTASLEAHIDRLHEQLMNYEPYHVSDADLEPYRGLNAKTCKSMVSGLHHDATEINLKIRELRRACQGLEDILNAS